MALAIEQFFLRGRFHATRWRENPFADRYGEWPPSPWRLARSLAARWFEYSRETGDRDESVIRSLLQALASERPDYYLPPSAAQGPMLKQYQPVAEMSWSDPNAGSGAVKQAKTTLFPDSCFVVPPGEPVIWQWLGISLGMRERELLALLLSRITYFGRAESRSKLALSESTEEPNCRPAPSGGNALVLCFAEGGELDFGALLGHSDKEKLKAVPVPPGTEWISYSRPDIPAVKTQSKPPFFQAPESVQFAVGGHVLPEIPLWIKITERFRGRVLRVVSRDSESYRLLAGKEDGHRLTGAHEHAFYVLWPDAETNLPARLIVWRRDAPFQRDEVEAMMLAVTESISWTAERDAWARHHRRATEAGRLWMPRRGEMDDWTAQLVPLPSGTPLPKQFDARSRVWESVTPFARPHNRHYLRRNGRSRSEEEPEAICKRLIEKAWGVRPEQVVKTRDDAPWVKLHETVKMRKERSRGENRTVHVGPGYYLRVTFAEPFQGPLIVGDSAHFGLGVFRAVEFPKMY